MAHIHSSINSARKKWNHVICRNRWEDAMSSEKYIIQIPEKQASHDFFHKWSLKKNKINKIHEDDPKKNGRRKKWEGAGRDRIIQGTDGSEDMIKVQSSTYGSHGQDELLCTTNSIYDFRKAFIYKTSMVQDLGHVGLILHAKRSSSLVMIKKLHRIWAGKIAWLNAWLASK